MIGFLNCIVLLMSLSISLVTGLFAPKTIRSRERKFHTWNFRSLVCVFFSFFYLHSLMSFQPRITNRSFRCASPHLWNQLPVSFREPCTKHPADVTLSNSPPTCSPLSLSITHSLFCSRLKAHHKSYLSDLCRCNYRSLSGDR